MAFYTVVSLQYCRANSSKLQSAGFKEQSMIVLNTPSTVKCDRSMQTHYILLLCSLFSPDIFNVKSSRQLLLFAIGIKLLRIKKDLDAFLDCTCSSYDNILSAKGKHGGRGCRLTHTLMNNRGIH